MKERTKPDAMPTHTSSSPTALSSSSSKENNNSSSSSSSSSSSRNHLYSLLAISLVSVIFILSFSSSSSSSRTSAATTQSSSFNILKPRIENPNSPTPPSIAYYIYGSNGDKDRIIRLLHSIYHPRNQYILHLDLTASQSERHQLAAYLQSVPIFETIQNVNVIGKADLTNPHGSSSIASTLHAAALLLRYASNWDWFINLSAADYPLVTQDDLLHILSYLPKELNFVNHSSYIGWRESRAMKRIVIDPDLYILDESDIFYASQKRELPNAYRVYTGTAPAILSRKFVEFCIWGSDNLPRTILMYLSNTAFSLNNYFQTVLCNAGEFNKTIVNANLQYSSWERKPPHKPEPRALGLIDIDEMIQSGAAFATQFLQDDPVLDHIDQHYLLKYSSKKYLLKHEPGKRRNVPGGWCLGEIYDREGPCMIWGNADIIRPGPGAVRLEKHILKLLSNGTFKSRQCIVE